jgi:hypothetical protein
MQQKLIFNNEDTWYYIAGLNSRFAFNRKINDIFWSNDIILKSKVFAGLFGKTIRITEFDIKFYVNREIPTYTIEQFMLDYSELDEPKYIIIYAVRPPRKIRKKTEKELEDEMILAVSAASLNTAFL